MKEKELKKEEKEKVDEEIDNWEGKISELSREIDLLKNASNPKGLADFFNRETISFGKCEKCGAPYLLSALDAPDPKCEKCGRKLKETS